MLCSRFLLSFLALYMLLEEISAAVLPGRFRNRREVSWLDQDLFQRLDEQTDLSVGDIEETGRNMDSRPSHSETLLIPAEHLPVKQAQYQYRRKPNEKRRKVAPLDSIGSFQISSFRKSNDEPDHHWEKYRE